MNLGDINTNMILEHRNGEFSKVVQLGFSRYVVFCKDRNAIPISEFEYNTLNCWSDVKYDIMKVFFTHPDINDEQRLIWKRDSPKCELKLTKGEFRSIFGMNYDFIKIADK